MDSIFVLQSPRPDKAPHQDPKLTEVFESFFGVKRDPDAQFNIDMYKARIRVTANVLLLEANTRAAQAGKTAYTYVVGLGLGVWQIHPSQAQWYIDVSHHSLERYPMSVSETSGFYSHGLRKSFRMSEISADPSTLLSVGIHIRSE
jgi:hypothetical protein